MQSHPTATHSNITELPTSLRVISLNCWGLKFLSKHRHARLSEIGHQLAIASPAPEIVGLQECWTQQDYLKIRELTKEILPFGKFYWSGIFGGGLAILSKWPIIESSMYRYPLNGRPAAFYRGDWFVGKGVACARIQIGPGVKNVLEVFCTHLHAPYEQEPNDSYICHRTAQAWEIAKLMRHAAERGHMVLGLGDFNMVPLSLAHQLIEAHSPLRDIWRVMKPDSALGSHVSDAEKVRGKPMPSVKFSLEENGSTCDSVLNTWRWTKEAKKNLEKGKDTVIDPDAPDPRGRRLDYIFFYSNESTIRHQWRIEDVQVGMTMRHPTLRCSLSDHFSVEATLVRDPGTSNPGQISPPMTTSLPIEIYDVILTMTSKYDWRERRQRRLRILHALAQLIVSIACLIAVWWSPRNFVAFILMLISTLGFGIGVTEFFMGYLFVGSELRALREFEYEIKSARNLALRKESAVKAT